MLKWNLEDFMPTRYTALLIAGICLSLGSMLPGVALGQDRPQPGIDVKPVGRVQTVAGSARIEHTSAIIVQAKLPSTGVGQAKADDDVYQGDVVVTGADGQMGIVFGDGTSFNVSKNARMEINEFVYDPKGSSNSTLFSLTKGTFTFLAGKAAKSGNMRVETPVGTMGIRGTAPHVEILDDGRVKFSTLIEEKKNVKTEQKAQPTQKAEQKQPVPAAPERRVQRPTPNLDICRNC
jgi:hypothetical protein